MERASADRAGDDGTVVRLDDRVLGTCIACARPIRFADNYIRHRGAPVHLSCALVAARAMRDNDL
jgi:hypothetical protein